MPLSAIIGHRHVVDLLRQAVVRDRVPQSLLFAGPDGVGKRTVAVALAQAVNCPTRKAAEPPGADACGVCPVCVRIARGQHSDVSIIDRGDAASLKIEVLRQQVLEVIGYRPFEAARRVFIIDSADAMTAQAQDALLKTLEEPPASAILVLVTAYPDTLNPTIQSRCRRVRFGPLAEADVARVLVERCGIDAAAARALASASGGRVGAALAEDSGELAGDREAAMALVSAAGRRGAAVAERLKAAAVLVDHESKRRSRDALGARLAILQSLLRDLVAIRAGQREQVVNVDLEASLDQLSSAFDLPRLSRAFAAVTEAAALLDRYASPKIVSDWVAVTL